MLIILIIIINILKETQGPGEKNFVLLLLFF